MSRWGPAQRGQVNSAAIWLAKKRDQEGQRSSNNSRRPSDGYLREYCRSYRGDRLALHSWYRLALQFEGLKGCIKMRRQSRASACQKERAAMSVQRRQPTARQCPSWFNYQAERATQLACSCLEITRRCTEPEQPHIIARYDPG